MREFDNERIVGMVKKKQEARSKMQDEWRM